MPMTHAERQARYRSRHPTAAKMRPLTPEEVTDRASVIIGKPGATFMGLNLYNWAYSTPRAIVEHYGMAGAVDRRRRKDAELARQRKRTQ